MEGGILLSTIGKHSSPKLYCIWQSKPFVNILDCDISSEQNPGLGCLAYFLSQRLIPRVWSTMEHSVI